MLCEFCVRVLFYASRVRVYLQERVRLHVHVCLGGIRVWVAFVMCCALYFVRCALCVVRCGLCVVRCALCVVRCALCVVRCVLCVVRCT